MGGSQYLLRWQCWSRQFWWTKDSWTLGNIQTRRFQQELVQYLYLALSITCSHLLSLSLSLSLTVTDRYEKPPYDQGTMRSAYHVRSCDVFRLKQVCNG